MGFFTKRNNGQSEANRWAGFLVVITDDFVAQGKVSATNWTSLMQVLKAEDREARDNLDALFERSYVSATAASLIGDSIQSARIKAGFSPLDDPAVFAIIGVIAPAKAFVRAVNEQKEWFAEDRFGMLAQMGRDIAEGQLQQWGLEAPNDAAT